MTVSRRRLLQAAALAGVSVPAASGQVPLSEERLRALAPVLALRKAPLQRLREFAIDDRVGPTQGVLDGGE